MILLLFGENVGLKNLVLNAVKPVIVFCTVIGEKDDAAGNLTVKLFEVAANTFALVEPKKTLLLVGVVLNKEPAKDDFSDQLIVKEIDKSVIFKEIERNTKLLNR